MDPITIGDNLWRQAYELVEKRLSMDGAAYGEAAKRKVAEIKDFFDHYGPQVDEKRPDIITGLGEAYDVLVEGASEHLRTITPSPLWVGLKTFGTDVAQRTASAASAVGDAAGAIGKNLHKIAIGLAVAAGAVAVAIGLSKIRRKP